MFNYRRLSQGKREENLTAKAEGGTAESAAAKRTQKQSPAVPGDRMAEVIKILLN